MAPTLGYWDIRGLAQPIRILLVYTGTEFEDKQYSCGPAPTFDRSAWNDIKFSFGLDFPNLPYYIEGDVKITQSNAILRHLGRKHGLEGKTETEKIRVDMMAENAMDFRNGFVRLCYNPNFANLKDDYIKNLDGTLKKFSDYLEDRKFFAGASVTFPDFHMYEMLYSHRLLAPEVVNKYDKLVAFIENIEKLPRVEAFLKSDKSPKPLNNKMAKFGQA